MEKVRDIFRVQGPNLIKILSPHALLVHLAKMREKRSDTKGAGHPDQR